MAELELLMPAGSLKKQKLAFQYGADAVYLGPPFFSLRARENEFTLDNLAKSIDYTRSLNKKVYLTLNIFARNRKLKPFRSAIESYRDLKPDAFIVSDPGLAMICKEMAPEIPLHLSVQANVMNWMSAKFWHNSLGIERVILSRELSIREISEIKQRVPELELEAFVHGSVCIAYSGRCLLSSYMSKRDPNQGVCDNSCRESFKTYKPIALEKEVDPGRLYPMEEDEHGTYILNSKDLCMIDHLDELVKAGVISFKVEGRTKSEFYVAMVARAYRGALNNLVSGQKADSKWRTDLERLSHRGYHTAFMLDDPHSFGQNYETSFVHNEKTKFVGLVTSATGTNVAQVEVKGKFQVGDELEIITPGHEEKSVRVLNIRQGTKDGVEVVHPGSGVFEVEFDRTVLLKENSLLLREVVS